MTRRRSSVAEDIAEITSRMPWWVAVVLAAVSYFVLHMLASRPIAVDPQVGRLSMVAVMTKGLATGGQYVLPIIFLLGSLVSGLRRLRAASLRELYGVMAARGAAGACRGAIVSAVRQ